MSAKKDGSYTDCKFTPPTKTKKVRNPFDQALIHRLHKPICSPGMCKIYKKEKNGVFKWDIDQMCALVPTDIVVCSSQFEPSPDPILEKMAEEATDRFFSQELVVPSPLESSKKVRPILQDFSDTSDKVSSIKEDVITKKDVSAQTVLTLPPNLPPEIEDILQKFCTFTQDQNESGDYVITANEFLRRKLFFEEHSSIDHYDSDQTDDEVPREARPPSVYEDHSPIVISPNLSRDLVTKGLKRTFETPLKRDAANSGKPYRNKVLDVVDFGEPCFSPIEFRTPKRVDHESATSSSLASMSISPVPKVSSDDEKNNFTSPECEAMATCLDCIIPESESEKKRPCFCNMTPNKISLKRSASLKESPTKPRKGTSLEKRSLSMTSLNRSRSVQKLDFSMDMSVDGSIHNCSQDSENSSSQGAQATWSIVEDSSIQQVVKLEAYKQRTCDIQSSTQIDSDKNILDDTPIKGKSKYSVLSHEISKIRSSVGLSSARMSLDNTMDSSSNPSRLPELSNSDNLLGLEDKKIDFNTIDLKFLTESISNYTYNPNTRAGESSSFKRLDSGFNENTFYANASSYYESAIKPSELTVTNTSKLNTSNFALKEISNVNWMRVDSGFKDETSADYTNFYQSEHSVPKFTGFRFSEAKLTNKENLEECVNATNRNETLSMSDVFAEDMKFNCNFSSTPSKSKSRKANF